MNVLQVMEQVVTGPGLYQSAKTKHLWSPPRLFLLLGCNNGGGGESFSKVKRFSFKVHRNIETVILEISEARVGC